MIVAHALNSFKDDDDKPPRHQVRAWIQIQQSDLVAKEKHSLSSTEKQRVGKYNAAEIQKSDPAVGEKHSLIMKEEQCLQETHKSDLVANGKHSLATNKSGACK